MVRSGWGVGESVVENNSVNRGDDVDGGLMSAKASVAHSGSGLA